MTSGNRHATMAWPTPILRKACRDELASDLRAIGREVRVRTVFGNATILLQQMGRSEQVRTDMVALAKPFGVTPGDW